MRGRSVLLVSIASVAFAIAGCGGGGSNETGKGGTTGGTAGTTGTAGTSAAGTTGTAGTSAAGTTGTAGTSAAGTTGTAGTSAAGTTGTAGTSAAGTTGTAGSGVGGSSAAGTGGTARGGSGGAGGGGQAGRGGTTGGAGRGGTTGTGGATGTAGAGAFILTSPMLADGAVFPMSATCEATGTRSLLPELNWDGVPAGTMSFALAFIDKTILDGNPTASTGHHSIMWDIPAGVRQLPMGLPAGSPPAGIAALAGSKQKNPLSNAYLGPCPNHAAEDTYNFELYALSQATATGVNQSDSVVMIRTKIMALNPLGKAILSGRSNAMGTLK